MTVYAVLQSTSRFLELYLKRSRAEERAAELTARYPRQKPYTVAAIKVTE